MVALIFAAKNITPWYIMHVSLAGLIIIYQWPTDEGSVVLLSSLASINKKFNITSKYLVNPY